jgi:cytochrome c556
MKNYLYAVMVLLAGFFVAPLSLASSASSDTRIEVIFPPLVKSQTLATMRRHLEGMAAIQQALAEKHFDAAAAAAVEYLGVSSPLNRQSMQDEIRYMPADMKKLGANMHRSVAQFAVIAQNADVTGDIQPSLQALASITQACVACHTTYKLR